MSPGWWKRFCEDFAPDDVQDSAIYDIMEAWADSRVQAALAPLRDGFLSTEYDALEECEHQHPAYACSVCNKLIAVKFWQKREGIIQSALRDMERQRDELRGTMACFSAELVHDGKL